MSIEFDGARSLFILETRNTAYHIGINDQGQLIHLHYGARLHGSGAGHIAGKTYGIYCPYPGEAACSSYSPNLILQEYSASGSGDYRTPCLEAVFADGGGTVSLRYSAHEIIDGKYPLDGLPGMRFAGEDVQSLLIDMRDEKAGIEVVLKYAVCERGDLIARAAEIRNTGAAEIRLESALTCILDFYESDWDWIRFTGRPHAERMTVRSGLSQGVASVGSTSGVTGHSANPFCILCEPSATEDSGACYGAALLYSGNFQMSVYTDMYRQNRLSMGIHPQGFRYLLEPGEAFQTPEAALAFTRGGLSALSGLFHKGFRDYLLPEAAFRERRPVLINSWEAVLYNFNREKLLDMAQKAAAAGIELFVIDDGWFGGRGDDTTSLGDWHANEEKLGGSLAELSADIRRTGMKLGLWIEPEMISEKSALYEAHEDYCLKLPGRAPSLCRTQMALDMSRADVQDYLYGRIASLIEEAELSYIKWDMNRPLTDLWSRALPPARQGELSHRYVLGVYRLLGRLTAAYPHVLFESCASGGGRFDPGMLYYTPQIWASDNTDALGRILVQYDTSFGYPACCVGAHVSKSPNHQTHRASPLKTRTVIAQAGVFGYELDITKLRPEELEQIREDIAFYKNEYDVIHYGDYYRLADPRAGHCTAWQFVSGDRRRSLIGYVQMQTRPYAPFYLLKCKGLAREEYYEIFIDGNPEPEALTGAALMEAGLPLQPEKQDLHAKQILLCMR